MNIWCAHFAVYYAYKAFKVCLLKTEVKKELPKAEEKEVEKPKINIDVDSVIVNENVITDDEVFDDFFGDDE